MPAGQLPLNTFTYYFEDFLDITTNLVNCQLIPTPKYSRLVTTCSKLTIETLEQGVKYVQS